MNQVALILLSVLVIVGAIAVALVVAFAKKGMLTVRRGSGEMAARLGVDEQAFASGKPVQAWVEGQTCYVRYVRPGKNQPPGVVMTFPDIRLPRLTILREGFWQRFSKRIGLTVETLTGDSAFDDKFFLLTEEDTFYKAFFQDSGRRAGVRDLFGADPTLRKIVASSGGLVLTFQARQRALPTLSPAQAAGMLAGFHRYDGHAYAHLADERSTLLGGMFLRVLAYSILVGAVLVGGLVALITGCIVYRLTDSSLLLTGLTWGILPLLTVWLAAFYGLRGHSWSHCAFFPLFFASLAAFPLVGMGSAVFLNGYLDDSRPDAHHVVVLDKYFRKNKNSKTYYVTFTGWKSEQPCLTFSVPLSLYESVDQGSDLVVLSHPGYFHAEWVESIQRGAVPLE